MQDIRVAALQLAAALSAATLLVPACGAASGTGPAPPTPSPTSSVPAAYFPAGAVWYRDVSREALDPQSAAVIANLDRAGWGLGRMQIDFSIEVLEAAADTPLLAFAPTADHFRPDCDLDPVPVPAGGALEGESGYDCRGDGDCHLIVVDRPRRKLYEMWRANLVGGLFRGGCLGLGHGPRLSADRAW